MSKWYTITGHEDPDTREVLLEEVDGEIFERYVINQNGRSWKVSQQCKFHYGYNIERFERYRKLHPEVKVTEVTEEEAFTIML